MLHNALSMLLSRQVCYLETNCKGVWWYQWASIMGCIQVVEVIEPQRRDQRIDELLQKYHKSRKNRVIVFVLYKKEASRVEAQLGKKGWKVRAAALWPVTVFMSCYRLCK